MLVEAGRLREALHAVRRRGFAHVPGAVSDSGRRALVDAAPDRFEPLPPQPDHAEKGEFALLPADDRPPVAELASELMAIVREHAEPAWGLEELDFNEAVWQRYQSPDAGIAPHYEDARHRYLVALLTLEGEASFSVALERGGEEIVDSTVVRPGDLTLLWAPGFGCEEDSRPLHSVGPPAVGNRMSFALRHNRYGPGGRAER